jgi:hypothetical protein
MNRRGMSPLLIPLEPPDRLASEDLGGEGCLAQDIGAAYYKPGFSRTTS